MYGIIATGIYNWPVIKQTSWLLGKVMNVIYNVMDGVFGIQNIGICIIIFTIVYLFFDDPAYDQAAEVVQDAVCNEPGASKNSEEVRRKKRSGIHAEAAGRDECGI